jgi:crotonobetainyl-CoA:carnitine CoA-transferase CaiB-like acyl-CoA transferase
MWQGVCRAIEKPEWEADERFCSSNLRAANRAILIPLLAQVFATATVNEWVTRLSAQGVPCTSVNSIDKVVKDEQVAARDMIVEIEHPTAGTIRMAGLPVKLSATPGSVRRHAPLLGEHSAEVLHELGLSEERVRALVGKGIIGVPG